MSTFYPHPRALWQYAMLILLIFLDVLAAVYSLNINASPWSWFYASLAANEGAFTIKEWLCFVQIMLFAATTDQLIKGLVRSFNRRNSRLHIPKLVLDLEMILTYSLAIFATCLILYELSLKSLLAASGAITLISAYALREWVSDITASVQIQTTGLARAEDWLRFYEGPNMVTSKVVDLDQQLVTLNDKNGTVRKIRNSRFLQMSFVNLSHNPEGAVRTLSFHLSSALPEPKILAILHNVMEHVILLHEFHSRYLCLVRSIDDGEIEYSIEYRCAPQIAPNVSNHLIMLAAVRFFRAANINLRSQHLQLPPSSEAEGAPLVSFTILENCKEYGFLKLLGTKELGILSRLASVIYLESEDVLLEQGATGSLMYFLLEGRLEVQIDSPDQRKITVGQVWPGECVGEMSLLTGDPYSATVFAKTDVRLLAIPKEAFADLFKLYPGLVDQLTKIMASRLLKNHALLAASKTQPESAKSLAGRICAFFRLTRHSQDHSLEMVR